jgi:hypothetical protein
MSSSSRTVVEHYTYNLKIESLNPVSGTERERANVMGGKVANALNILK